MKTRINIYFLFKATAWWLVAILLVTLTSVSCIKESAEPYITSPNEERTIQLRIGLPASSAGQNTRSVTDREENHISTIYILSYRIEDDNSEIFDYWTQGKETEGNDNGSPVQNFSAILKVREHPQRLVLLANIGEDTKRLIEQGNWHDAEKEAMLARFEENLDGQELKWNAASALDYRPIPMWGESMPETIHGSTKNLTETIPLLRMVAKIDVQLDENIAGLTDKFRLKSVRLYNTNTKGRLVPDKNNTVAGAAGRFRTVYVKAPSIPSDIFDYSARYFGPVLYEDFSAPGQWDVAMRNAIYLFEAASAAEHTEATCLVVGGIYGDDNYETFYRVDFIGDDGHTLLDILRNDKFTINIIDVKQSGYNDPDEAFHSKTGDMEISIIHWNEVDIDEIWFDQVYYYSVSPRLFDKDGAASTGNRVRVETDYPEWSYKISTNSDPAGNSGTVNWLEVQSHTEGVKYPGNGTVDHIVFNVTATNTHIRTAYIHITTGRVIMTVTVKQTHWSPPTFTVTPTGTIPGAGQVRTVTAVGGKFFTLDIRAIELNYYTNVGFETIRNGIHNNSTDITIQYFPATNQTRQVRLEYKNPITGDWVFIREDTQISFYWS